MITIAFVRALPNGYILNAAFDIVVNLDKLHPVPDHRA